MRTKASGTWPPCRRLKTNYISKTVPHGSLSLAQAVFQTQRKRWDAENLGGGFK